MNGCMRNGSEERSSLSTEVPWSLVLYSVVDAQGVGSSPLFVSSSGLEEGDGSEEGPFS